MRISLLVGATVYPLAGEAGVSERDHSSAADWEHQAVPQKQPLDLLRASHAHDLDRGNLRTTISFTTTRKFATAAAAWLFDLDYDRTRPREGTLVLEALSTTGDASVRHLLNALVEPPRRRVTGCTVLLSYLVTGGAVIFISNSGIPGDALLTEGGAALLAEDGENLLTES